MAELFGIPETELEDVREALGWFTVTDKVADVKAKLKRDFAQSG